jgi:hypothetical protein
MQRFSFLFILRHVSAALGHHQVFCCQSWLISLWLYKENKLQDWKKCIYSTSSPLSATQLWLRCSNCFKPSKKNSFVSAANRKIGNRKSQAYQHPYVLILLLLYKNLLKFVACILNEIAMAMFSFKHESQHEPSQPPTLLDFWSKK